MKLKVPPAIQLLIFIFIMWSIAKVSDVKHLDFEYQKNVSRVLFGIGIAVGVLAMYAFWKAKTTVDPSNPEKASKLVIVSIYRVTRNPMYLGMLCILIGFGLRLGNFYTFPIVLLFIWYITTFQIKPEEEVLRQLFGEEYEEYCKKVRRWI